MGGAHTPHQGVPAQFQPSPFHPENRRPNPPSHHFLQAIGCGERLLAVLNDDSLRCLFDLEKETRMPRFPSHSKVVEKTPTPLDPGTRHRRVLPQGEGWRPSPSISGDG